MFEKLRKEYKKFTYEKYDINETFSEIIITYYFNIDGKEKFNPTLKFSKSIIKNNNIEKTYAKEFIGYSKIDTNDDFKRYFSVFYANKDYLNHLHLHQI